MLYVTQFYALRFVKLLVKASNDLTKNKPPLPSVNNGEQLIDTPSPCVRFTWFLDGPFRSDYNNLQRVRYNVVLQQHRFRLFQQTPTPTTDSDSNMSRQHYLRGVLKVAWKICCVDIWRNGPTTGSRVGGGVSQKL